MNAKGRWRDSARRPASVANVGRVLAVKAQRLVAVGVEQGAVAEPGQGDAQEGTDGLLVVGHQHGREKWAVREVGGEHLLGSHQISSLQSQGEQMA
jgi:hypothetical protein